MPATKLRREQLNISLNDLLWLDRQKVSGNLREIRLDSGENFSVRNSSGSSSLSITDIGSSKLKGDTVDLSFISLLRIIDENSSDILSFSHSANKFSLSTSINLDITASIIKLNHPTLGTALEVNNNGSQNYVKVDNKLGVGVVPTYTLDVNGDVRAYGDLLSSKTSPVNIGTLTNQAVQIITNNTPRIYIKNDGSVGIGTTGPSATLDVRGNVRFLSQSDSFSRVFFEVKSENGMVFPSLIGGQQCGIVIKDRSSLIGGLWLNGGDYNVIGSRGGIGVGLITDLGTYRALTTSSSFIIFYDGHITFFSNTGLTPGNNFSPSEKMRIDTAGNVSIGAIAPNYKLDVNGDIRCFGDLLSSKVNTVNIGTLTNQAVQIITNNMARVIIPTSGYIDFKLPVKMSEGIVVDWEKRENIQILNQDTNGYWFEYNSTDHGVNGWGSWNSGALVGKVYRFMDTGQVIVLLNGQVLTEGSVSNGNIMDGDYVFINAVNSPIENGKALVLAEEPQPTDVVRIIGFFSVYEG
jgi:hypothetical protein